MSQPTTKFIRFHYYYGREEIGENNFPVVGDVLVCQCVIPGLDFQPGAYHLSSVIADSNAVEFAEHPGKLYHFSLLAYFRRVKRPKLELI